MIKFEDIEVGQEIGITSRYNCGKIATVVKKTKTMIMTECGLRFNKHLEVLPRESYSGTFITEVSEVRRMRFVRELNIQTRKDVEAVETFIRRAKNGNGIPCYSQKSKDELIELVRKITINHNTDF